MKNPRLLSLIITPLLLTALFYYFFRDGTVAYKAVGIDSNLLHFFNNDMINALPSFAHVYSFSLLTWFVNGQKNGLFSSLLWVMINIAFELAQALSIEQLSGFPSVLKDYFSHGSFSGFDLVAIFIGGLMAYLTTVKMSEVKMS